VDDPLGRPLIGEVSDQNSVTVRAARQVPGDVPELLLPARAEYEPGAVGCELIGDRAAQAPGGPADEQPLPLEFHAWNLPNRLPHPIVHICECALTPPPSFATVVCRRNPGSRREGT
jgi:hypothetical protein